MDVTCLNVLGVHVVTLAVFNAWIFKGMFRTA